jgi:hypothetical protein
MGALDAHLHGAELSRLQLNGNVAAGAWGNMNRDGVGNLCRWRGQRGLMRRTGGNRCRCRRRGAAGWRNDAGRSLRRWQRRSSDTGQRSGRGGRRFPGRGRLR